MNDDNIRFGQRNLLTRRNLFGKVCALLVGLGVGPASRALGRTDGGSASGEAPGKGGFHLSTIEELRSFARPVASGQTVSVVEYHAGTGLGGGVLRCLGEGFDPNEDDGVLNFVDAGGRKWRRVEWRVRSDVNVEWAGAAHDYHDHNNPGTDDHDAIQRAIDTGFNVYLPKGRYRIHTKELLFTRAGQRMRGDGCGASYFGPHPATTHEGVTDLVFTGTGQAYVKTRRRYRAGPGDPQDEPVSTAIHISNAGVQIEDLAVLLSVDYGDRSPGNLGSEWDVGVFIRTVPQVRFRNLRVLGYWRDSAIRYDGTQAANLPGFTTPDGIELPGRAGGTGSQYSGFDQSFGENVFVQGGLKGLWLAGPLLDDRDGDYYDEILGRAVSDNRGGAGAADFRMVNGTFFSREHHTRRRAMNPRSPLDIDEEDLDRLACAICIDARGVAGGRRHVRRLLFEGIRVRSFEAGHIVVGHGTEIYFDNLHTEPSPGSTVFDASGEKIDQTDYSPETGTYYGPIAVQADRRFRARTIVVRGINFRKPAPAWFQDQGVVYDITGVGSSSRGRNEQSHTSFYNGINLPNEYQARALGSASVRFNSRGVTRFERQGDAIVNVERGAVTPGADNTKDFGSPQARWREVFAANGAINTSDGRVKGRIESIPDEVLDAWEDVEYQRFKWNSAIKAKGEKARWHTGVVAQQIEDVFRAHGLNPFEWGLLCYDEWGEQLDDETGEARPAGNRYSVRPTECLFMEAALLRRELRALRNR